MLVVRRTPDDWEAQFLLEMLQSEYVGMFGEVDPNPVGDLDKAVAPHGGILLGTVFGEPMAVGGWTREHTEHDCPNAVLRRMYVHYRHRRKGYSKALLNAIEHDARLSGCTRMILETDIKMGVAITLYKDHGYTATEPFGFYKDSNHSIFLGRDL